jgi:hypothetical protein
LGGGVFSLAAFQEKVFGNGLPPMFTGDETADHALFDDPAEPQLLEKNDVFLVHDWLLFSAAGPVKDGRAVTSLIVRRRQNL